MLQNMMRRISLSIAMLVLLLSGPSCAGEDPAAGLVAAALERMAASPGKNDRFVILEDGSGEKFVQFAMEEDRFHVEVPTQILDANERPRASALFASIGIAAPNLIETESPEGAFRMHAYQLVRADAASAAALALRIHHEVFRIEPAKLRIVESGFTSESEPAVTPLLTGHDQR